MTAIVGVLCRDGAVIGCDSSATFGSSHFHTIEQPTEKLDIIGTDVVVAGTGQVGLGQRFKHLVTLGRNGTVFDQNNHPIDVAKWLSKHAIEDLASTHMKMGQYAALVAFVAQGAPRLCEFDSDHFQPEFKDDRLWYCSMGSGQAIGDPFLGFLRDVFWTGPPSVQQGIFAVTWTLDHIIALNAGGVNGPARLAVLERNGDGVFAARISRIALRLSLACWIACRCSSRSPVSNIGGAGMSGAAASFACVPLPELPPSV